MSPLPSAPSAPTAPEASLPPESPAPKPKRVRIYTQEAKEKKVLQRRLQRARVKEEKQLEEEKKKRRQEQKTASRRKIYQANKSIKMGDKLKLEALKGMNTLSEAIRDSAAGFKDSAAAMKTDAESRATLTARFETFFDEPDNGAPTSTGVPPPPPAAVPPPAAPSAWVIPPSPAPSKQAATFGSPAPPNPPPSNPLPFGSPAPADMAPFSRGQTVYVVAEMDQVVAAELLKLKGKQYMVLNLENDEVEFYDQVFADIQMAQATLASHHSSFGSAPPACAPPTTSTAGDGKIPAGSIGSDYFVIDDKGLVVVGTFQGRENGQYVVVLKANNKRMYVPCLYCTAARWKLAKLPMLFAHSNLLGRARSNLPVVALEGVSRTTQLPSTRGTPVSPGVRPVVCIL